jgi:nucleoside-diphosphate-sugar epimerase
MLSGRESLAGRHAIVAGGAGFIGSNLCARLLDLGMHVTCIDNMITGRERNLRALIGQPNFALVRHDLIDPPPPVVRPDAIFHLASPASPPGYQRFPIETLRVNSEGTLHLLRLADEQGARFLYASTSEAYGDPLEHPQRESYRGNVSPTGPRSMYDESKRYGEALTMAFSRTRSVNARIVRIFNTYGPGSDPADGRVVPNLITQALTGKPMTIYGNGLQTRSLCYVSDLVEGLIDAMASDDAAGDVVNLGNPEEHTILEFAQVIASLTDRELEVEYCEPAVGDDPQRRQPDITRATTLLGWTPKVGLREGLAKTIEYFRAEIRVPVLAGSV